VTVLLDEGFAPGGQIHRYLPSASVPRNARRWLERLAGSGAAVRNESAVFDAERDDSGFRIAVETRRGPLRVRARRLVLATGARELFLPFPGWTLPGVMGAGGAQALWKSGASFAGRRAVVAGSGPLLLPVAASLSKAGAAVEFVAEQARMSSLMRFGAALARTPRRLLDAAAYRRAFSGTPYRFGMWIAEAGGREKLEYAVLTDGQERFRVNCDLAAVGFGLVPNVELARLLGCEIRGGAVVTREGQAASIDGVFAAGEPCGVAGIEVAIAEGELAGIAAAARGSLSKSEARRLSAARARGRRFAAAMNRAFRPRKELAALARPETIVCRCEDVPLGRITACAGLREAKLSSRAGMGPCQGRVCGPALAFLFGWESDTVRPPVKPASLGDLVAMEESA
jgi:NADPH-dependent 2,4-dienoyl-CoA reductase/sulfur reductase-like enzyme